MFYYAFSNVDAAICWREMECGRSELGEFLGALTQVMYGTYDPACTEMIACRERLCLAQDQGVTSSMIASDCQGVICTIIEGGRGENIVILKEISFF